MRRTGRYFSTGALLLVVLVACAPSAQASGLTDEPFGLKLNLALERGSAFTDIVGLAASAAYPYGSSLNPAGADFLRDAANMFRFSGTLTGVHVALGGGSSLSAGAVGGTVRFERAGTLVGDYTYFDSHDLASHQGDVYKLQGHRVALWYSQHVSSAVVLGGRLDFAQSTLKVHSTRALDLLGLGEFEDFPVRTKTDTVGIEFAVGMLASLTQHWLLGVVGGAGWARSSTSGTLDLSEDFGGPQPVSFHDNTRSLNFRGGIGWRPSDAFGAYAEVQYLRFLNVSHSMGNNAVDVVRGRLGFEWLPRPFVALRASGTVDSDRQVSPGVGIGFYPIKTVQGELAYVYNAFPEVRKEFGRAHLITASVAFVF